MKKLELILKVRALTRDFSNSIFREQDITSFINEAINRCKQRVPELKGMNLLLNAEDKPILLPEEYHELLSVYATSRCFAQDERHYQASTYMNEFEVKIDELKTAIENGEVIIVDETGTSVSNDLENDYVDLSPYYGDYTIDDEGS